MVRPGKTESGNMPSVEVNPTSTKEPELNLLLAPDTFEPLYKSLFRGLDEFFFSQKASASQAGIQAHPGEGHLGLLQLQEKWRPRFYCAHVVVLALIIGGTILAHRWVTKVEAKPQTATTQLIDPGDYSLKPAKTQAGAEAEAGTATFCKPREENFRSSRMQPQLAPPTAVIRNFNPKLAVEPTVIVPPEIRSR